MSIPTTMRPLSDREIEVLKHVAAGLSNKRIARVFSKGEQTVKNHITSIMRKMNADDRTRAVVLAIHLHIIDLEEVVALGDSFVSLPCTGASV